HRPPSQAKTAGRVKRSMASAPGQGPLVRGGSIGYPHRTMRWQLGILLLASLSVGFGSASAAPKSPPKVIVLSLQGVDGGHCLSSIEAELRKVRGVTGVRFDTRTVEARIEVRRLVPMARLLKAVEDAGYLAIEGPGQGRWTPPRGFPDSSDVAIV